jgi:hypothetical protein
MAFAVYFKKYGLFGSIHWLGENISLRYSGTFLMNILLLFVLKGYPPGLLMLPVYIVILAAFAYGAHLLLERSGVVRGKGMWNTSFYISVVINVFAGMYFFIPCPNELFFWINCVFFYFLPFSFFILFTGLLFSRGSAVVFYVSLPLIFYCGGVSEIVWMVFLGAFLFLLILLRSDRLIRQRLIVTVCVLVVSGLFNISGKGFSVRVNYENKRTEQMANVEDAPVSGFISKRQLLAMVFLFPLIFTDRKNAFSKTICLYLVIIFIAAALLSFCLAWIFLNGAVWYRFYYPAIMLGWIFLVSVFLSYNPKAGSLDRFLTIGYIAIIFLTCFHYIRKIKMARLYAYKYDQREMTLNILKQKGVRKPVALWPLPDAGPLVSSELSPAFSAANNQYQKEYLDLPFDIYLDKNLKR